MLAANTNWPGAPATGSNTIPVSLHPPTPNPSPRGGGGFTDHARISGVTGEVVVPVLAGEVGASLNRFPETLRRLQIDGNELRDALFGHRDAKQAVHARHGQRVVGDDQKTRRGFG